MSLKIEEVNDLDRLQEFENDWSELLSRCPHQSLFLTFEWITNWYRYFGRESKPRVLLLIEDGGLVLIAPMMDTHGPTFRHIPWIRTRMIHSASNYHSNRFDFIYENLHRHYIDALFKYLSETSRWHLLRLFPVQDSSSTFTEIKSHVDKKRIHMSLVPSQTSPYIAVDSSWDEFVNNLSSSEMKRKGRRAEREREKGNLEFDLLSGEVDDLTPNLEEIFEVADSAWAGEAGTAISSTPTLRGFYSDLAHLANRRGWLFFSLLRIDDQLAAFAYNLKYAGKVYNLKVAFHPDFGKKNPGHSLTWLTLASIFSRGGEIGEFDFLGDSDSYKVKWTSRVRRHWKITLYNRESLYSRVVYLFEKGVVERGRRIRKRRQSR